MNLTTPLLHGTLVKRYKRFLADIRLDDGTTITAHCANSGSMATCAEPGRAVVISDSQNPARKLRHTWELIHMGDTWVGVNTATPNRAVAEFIEAGHIPELSGYGKLKREVKYGAAGKSRIDILLTEATDGGPDCYVEIKNATMRVGEHAAFPDAVTTRGQKHLEELMHVVSEGDRAVLFFFVGRSDCVRFRPADEIDAVYGRLLRKAVKFGVDVLPYRMRFEHDRVAVLNRVPLDL